MWHKHIKVRFLDSLHVSCCTVMTGSPCDNLTASAFCSRTCIFTKKIFSIFKVPVHVLERLISDFMNCYTLWYVRYAQKIKFGATLVLEDCCWIKVNFSCLLF
jgi:hypothetical protein